MQIVVDVTCDLSEKHKDKVKYIPMYIIKENEKIKIDENFDLVKNFYENEELKSSWLNGKLKTSQPTLKDVVEALRSIDDNEILVITVSKLLSGTYNVIKNASRFIRDKKIYVYDSGTTTIGCGLLIKELLDTLKREELNIKEAAQLLNSIKVTIYFVPQDIGFLFKSGRMNILKYAFLKVINKKPLLKLERYEEIEFVKLVDKEIEELKKYSGSKHMWGADYFNYNKIPEPKILINPIVVVNVGPVVALATLKYSY